MHHSRLLLAAAAAVMATGIAACNRDTNTTPKPKADTGQAIPGAGGPAHTEGGLKGNPVGGTPAGAATASSPEGPPPGAATAHTDQGGLASRPTEGPKKDDEPRPNATPK